MAMDVQVAIEVDHSAVASENDLNDRVISAVREAAKQLGFHHGTIGVLVTDDPSIHEVNRQHLSHDYPTDVISFGYEQSEDYVEGELIVSLDTAIREAACLGWSALNELLLYIVHGTLHICGMDDHHDEDRKRMRLVEQQTLAALGIDDADRFSPS